MYIVYTNVHKSVYFCMLFTQNGTTTAPQKMEYITMKVEKITLKMLNTLKPGTESKIADADLHNLQVWTRKTAVCFYFVAKYHGKQYHQMLGRYPDITLEEARQKVLDKLGKLANHANINAGSPRLLPTVGNVIDFYMLSVNGESNIKVCQSYFAKISFLRNRKICDLKKVELQMLHDQMSDTPVMANRVFKKLSAAISFFIRENEIELANPARNIRMFKEKPRLRFLSEDEAPKVIDALKSLQKHGQYSAQADAILMMIYTGQRKSNVLAMNTSEVNNGIWVIPKDKSKTSIEIVVPLNDYALEIYDRLKDNAYHGYVFWYGRKTKGPEHLLNVDKTFKTACSMAGVEDCHIHDLRRTLGSWMLMSGIDIATVSKTLGHTSIAVTEKVYAHLLPGKIASATNTAIGRMLSGKA